MKARVDAGTDIAKVGAWDAGRNDSAFAKMSASALEKALKEDAAAGRLFLIHTGADGGGPIDVFVDSQIPDELRKQSRPTDGEYLISVPSGRLVVGGVEDYRSGQQRITSAKSVIALPGGDYALRCFVGAKEGGFDPPSKAELQNHVGAEDYNYLRKIQILSLVAYFGVPLVFVVLAFRFGWMRALGISVVLGFVFFVIFKLFTRGNERFKRAARATNECWQRAAERQPPTFIFELRRLNDSTGLKGGSVRLNRR